MNYLCFTFAVKTVTRLNLKQGDKFEIEENTTVLGQESNEGKASNDEISKVSKSSPSLKHYVVPSPKTINEVESKDSPCTEVKPGIIKEYVFQDFKGNIY